nr:hypothetical protein [Streptococcus agalactiae]
MRGIPNNICLPTDITPTLILLGKVAQTRTTIKSSIVARPKAQEKRLLNKSHSLKTG